MITSREITDGALSDDNDGTRASRLCSVCFPNAAIIMAVTS